MNTLNLPKSTELNKKIPKQSFYENLDVPANIKKFFVDQIQSIIWKNKISPETTNLAAGETVTEIQVFEIKLNNKELNEEVLRLIDKKIPYHIIFLLECDGKYQAWTAYKEASLAGNSAFRVNRYYHTEWLADTEIPLFIEGLSIDKTYENMFKQIAGGRLNSPDDESLGDAVARNEKIEKINKQILFLQQKLKKEKQFNKQVQLNDEIKKLRKELTTYEDSIK